MEELRLRNKVTHLKRARKKPMVVCSRVPHSRLCSVARAEGGSPISQGGIVGFELWEYVGIP